MAEIVKEITVKASLDKTWALVSDMIAFSQCVPGCKEVKQISETEYDWVMEAKVLRTTRTVKARTRAAEMRPPVYSRYEGEGRLFEKSNYYKINISGTTNLESLGENETRIVFAGIVAASGIGGGIVERVAAGQMDGLFEVFEVNVKNALEGD